jgi:hypothetical protein
MRNVSTVGLVLMSCASAALGTTIQVGPGRTYTTLAAGYNAASAGDTIEIDSGTYYQSAGWINGINKANLTFRGVGPTRPVLDAGNSATGSKGIFVVGSGGTNLTVENLEFANAWISDGLGANAAGIRAQASGLTVRNCRFYNDQDGILGGGGTLLIEYSEFDRCGEDDPANVNGYGYTHNMYLNGSTLTLRYCWSHDANEGHIVKSRVATNYILYNLLSTETGTGSRELQIANGGTAYIIGNVILQGPNSHNNEIVAYGDETGISPGVNPNPYLYLVNNTLINQRSNATFLKISTTTNACLVQNNIFLGNGGETLIGGTYAGQAVLTTNWVTTNASLANIADHDYSLTAASTGAINAGTAPGTGYNNYSLMPVNQYLHPCNYLPRPTNGTIDIGGYEYVAPNQPPTVNAGADQDVYEGQLVQLHATASDPDSDPLTYGWTQTAGPTVTLNGADAADASFAAPAVSTVPQASMTFQVTVNDGKGGSANDSVNVRVYLAGDASHNDAVDISDLLAVGQAWNTSQADPRYNPSCDFNGDGLVDAADLLLLAGSWGRTLP